MTLYATILIKTINNDCTTYKNLAKFYCQAYTWAVLNAEFSGETRRQTSAVTSSFCNVATLTLTEDRHNWYHCGALFIHNAIEPIFILYKLIRNRYNSNDVLFYIIMRIRKHDVRGHLWRSISQKLLKIGNCCKKIKIGNVLKFTLAKVLCANRKTFIGAFHLKSSQFRKGVFVSMACSNQARWNKGRRTIVA